jgi:tetratricopeptide (TPR) repeat protein
VPDSETGKIQYAYLLQSAGEPQRALETLGPLLAKQVLDSNTLYDAACLYARLGDKANALAALRRALEGGFSHFDLFRTDNDLAVLREMPEFQELIRESESKRSS